jgi:hypothetical protein
VLVIYAANAGEIVMSKAITKEDMALLKEASEMFNETGCVPGIDGEQVPAERIVPDAKEYISETTDNPETLYDPEIWDTPGFALVLSWLATLFSIRLILVEETDHDHCCRLPSRHNRTSPRRRAA